MDFGLEGFVGSESGMCSSSSQVVSENEATINGAYHRSGFLKQERSGSDEDNGSFWRNTKTPKARGDYNTAPCDVSSKMSQGTTTALSSSSSLLRSNCLLSPDSGHSPNMLSFSSSKSELTFLTKSGGFVGGSTKNSPFPYYQQTRNGGYGGGGINSSMQGPFPGIRGPFTPSQWIELEHQALIYKYIMSGVAVPSNLLIALKKSLNPFGVSGSPSGSYAPNSAGWGSFHLGYAGNTDPEPGRCRRTDGKKWRCSRDAVPDQKYCERHVNRGRHRSRKHVEAQASPAISGPTTTPTTTTSNVGPTATANPSSGGALNNGFGIAQHQLKGLHPITSSATDNLVNRLQNHQGLSMVTPTMTLKSNDSPFSIPKQHLQLEDESSHSEFGLVSADSLLNPSQKSSYASSRNLASSYGGFSNQENDNQSPLRHFIDDWPKNQPDRGPISWPDELKSDWTQLSMSLQTSPQDKHSMSPLRLSRDLDPIQMGLGVSSGLSEPRTWGSSMGGPLGEVLTTTRYGGPSKKASGSSPTGVLQKTTFVSLSNSSSGSSPTADNRRGTNDGASATNFCDDMYFGPTIGSSFSLPPL